MRVGFPWISLDSLVRIVTFQLVTRIFPRQKFSRGFSFPSTGAGDRRPRPWAYGRAELLMKPSLTWLLTFCKIFVIHAVSETIKPSHLVRHMGSRPPGRGPRRSQRQGDRQRLETPRANDRFGRAKRGESSACGAVSVRSAKARPSARSAAQRSRRHGRGASVAPARLERRNARPARPVMSNAQDPGSGTPEMVAAL